MSALPDSVKIQGKGDRVNEIGEISDTDRKNLKIGGPYTGTGTIPGGSKKVMEYMDGEGNVVIFRKEGGDLVVEVIDQHGIPDDAEYTRNSIVRYFSPSGGSGAPGGGKRRRRKTRKSKKGRKGTTRRR
jgi:hypothetical protein